jgi:hypothetical protein
MPYSAHANPSVTNSIDGASVRAIRAMPRKLLSVAMNIAATAPAATPNSRRPRA